MPRGIKGSTPTGYDKGKAWRARNPERAKLIRNNSQRNWYQNNKEHSASKAAEWKAKNPEKRKLIANKYARANYQAALVKLRERKIAAVALLGGVCVDCHGVFDPVVYDFHHIDESTKDMNPSRAIRTRSWEVAKREIEKCVLLCGNCHRLRHWGEKQCA